jgi:hypothetical protein
MLCVDHGNGQVQASLKSDRGSGAQAPPRASPIAARDRGLPDSDSNTADCFTLTKPIDVLGRVCSLRADGNR